MPSSASIYENKVRVRACGICIQNGQILMINHKNLHPKDFWAPPGGGIRFGETAEECLIREFLEETHLNIRIVRHLFIYDFIQPPLHAIELFFQVEQIGGALQTGKDPESGHLDQIISEAKFLDFKEINEMAPETLHGVFGHLTDSSEILRVRGYIKP